MSSAMFVALLPQAVQSDDKIQIKGKVSCNAEQFSINFANGITENPRSIAYHFKWDLIRKLIIEDYKENGKWMDHRESHFDSLDGPEFGLEFTFQDDVIYVYLVIDDGRNMITHFQPKCDFSYIGSVQVWGDVEKITQLTFLYN